jgi:hypothetical protein
MAVWMNGIHFDKPISMSTYHARIVFPLFFIGLADMPGCEQSSLRRLEATQNGSAQATLCKAWTFSVF